MNQRSPLRCFFRSRPVNLRSWFPAVGSALFLITGSTLWAQQGIRTPELFLSEAHGKFVRGETQEALKMFSEFLKEYANQEAGNEKAYSQVRYLMVLSYAKLEDWQGLSTIGDKFLAKTDVANPSWIQDVLFWTGIAHMRLNNTDKAHQLLADFFAKYPDSPRAPLAAQLAGVALIDNKQFGKAGIFLDGILPKLPEPELGQALATALYSRLQEGNLDAVAAIANQYQVHVATGSQVVQCQLLLLDLGSKYANAGKHAEAAIVLSQILQAKDMLSRQETALENAKKMREAIRTNPENTVRLMSLDNGITAMEDNLEKLRGIENFDSLVQFQIASAFLSMQRYRETALLLNRMLHTLPRDKIVEQGSVTLIQCLYEINSLGRAVEAAGEFEKTFPDSKELPGVLYVKGKTLQGLGQHSEALGAFQAVLKGFPTNSIATDAAFEIGFTKLLMEDIPGGISSFENVRTKYPEHAMAGAALFWIGEAYSMDKQFKESRASHATYLEKYPKGDFVADARFRRAFCAHSSEDFATSIPEFRAYLSAYPSGKDAPEAIFLLGDGLLATGETEEGIRVLKSIPKYDAAAFSEGWFKIAKVYEAMNESDKLRAHLQQFIDENKKSPRVAEAVYLIGRTYPNDPKKAREIYWKALSDLGNDPSQWSIIEIFKGLRKLHRSEEDVAEYRRRLVDLQKEAEKSKKRSLLLQTLYTEGLLLGAKDPVGSLKAYTKAAELIDPKVDNPEVMVDIADSFRESGKSTEAEVLYREIRRWNPRTIFKDRVFIGLGLLAVSRGEHEKALNYFERFEKEATGSIKESEAYLSKGVALNALKRHDEAEQAWLKALEIKSAPGRIKAQALLNLGDMHVARGNHARAFPHYQRVYLLYGRWPEQRAEAYLRSGKVLEQLGKKSEAARTYQEMLAIEELANLKQANEARERMATLPKPPEPAIVETEGGAG